MRAPRRPRTRALHFVAMHQRAAAAAPGREAFGQHRRRPRRNPSRARSRYGQARPHEREQLVLARSRAHADSATICCASTSSGASCETMRSSSPRRTERSSAAHSIEIVARDAGTGAPSACRRRCGPSGRRAAAAWRCDAASRSGRRDRRGRCRCRARATRSRRAPCSCPVFSRVSASSRFSFDRLP